MSCKLSKGQDVASSGSNIGNMTFSKERYFIKSELDVGRRICAALKKKREFFQTLYDRQEQVRFQGTLTDCEGATTLDTAFIATILNASALEYSALTARNNYFRDIVTDQSPAITDVCLSLQASDNVLNTVKSGTLKYTINFLIAENYDRYDVKKEVADGNGGFSTSGAESILVFTQTNQAATKFFGVEKERTRLNSCGRGKYQSMKQVWKEALTNF